MKKKYTPEGRPYIFSTDEFLEGLSLAIVFNIHKVEIKERMTMEEKLWEASFHYLDNCDDDSAIFTHTMLGVIETQDQRVEYWIKEAIKTIMGYIPVKEKKVKLEWGNTYKTKNKVLVRETADGRFISLKTLTNGIIMSHADFNNLMKDLGMELEELTFVQFNRLEYDIRMTMGQDKYFSRYKTLRCFFEDLLTELGVKNKDAVSVDKYSLERSFHYEDKNDDELFNTASSIFTII
jgi:hypothetical protein